MPFSPKEKPELSQKTEQKQPRQKNSRPQKSEKVKRLQFLSDWMRLTGVTYEMACEKAGFSRQNLYHVLTRKDDMKLSSIIDILDAFGYQINLSYSRSDDKEDESEKKLDLSKLLTKENNSVKRLSFIYIALAKYGITKHELAEQMGLHDSAFTYYDSRLDGLGDMYMSRIIQIAECINASLNIDIVKKIVIIPEKNSLHTRILVESYDVL